MLGFRRFDRILLSIALLWRLLIIKSSNAELSISSPVDLVNLLAGTFTDGDRFSTGNTLPLVGRPWAFNHWSPQVKEGNRYTGSWWFRGSDHHMTWMRCTHQPSPWIGDYGWFLFSPQIGHPDRNPIHFWEPRGATIRPHLFDAVFAPNNIRMELTPTDHAAVVRITFPERKTTKHFCLAEAEWLDHGKVGGSVSFLNGKTTRVKQDRMLISNFNMFIRTEAPDAEDVDMLGDMACFRFKTDATAVTIRIVTSLISFEQASVNLEKEAPLKKGFDEIAIETKSIWNNLLKRADVIDPGDLSHANKHLTVFYTSIARALSFPRRIDEITKDGKMVHYSPYDPSGRVFDGPGVTDNGFWDTFRTVYPMLSLIYPDHLGVIVQGWLNAFKEGGWLPSWASPGYRNCMVGTYADVVVADAVVKGIKGFSLEDARAALTKDAFANPPKLSGGAVGKDGLEEYVQRGYFAYDANNEHRVGEVVSRTLDFGFADYACSNALKYIASLETADPEKKSIMLTQVETLSKRAQRAGTVLFDATEGLMVPKNAMGEKSPFFNNIQWGNGFTEGNAWHHSFPPYVLEDLAKLHGGKNRLLQKLHQMMDMPGNFQVGSYGQEIHEMTEARAVAMGQYAHNNQPSHHILYLFALLGEAKTTQVLVRKVLDKCYGYDFYAGDEDNGENSAWFVLSALGLYSVTPSSGDWVLGSPVFKHVRIHRKWEIDSATTDNQDAILDIVAQGTGPDLQGTLVREVLLNNAKVPGPTVSDKDIRKGVLRFIMESEKPGGDPSSISSSSSTSFTSSAKKIYKDSDIASKQSVQRLEEAVASLQAELAHAHLIEEELRHGERLRGQNVLSLEKENENIKSKSGDNAIMTISIIVFICAIFVAFLFIGATNRFGGFQKIKPAKLVV